MTTKMGLNRCCGYTAVGVVLAFAVIVAMAPAAPASAQESQFSAQAIKQLNALAAEKLSRTPAQKKLGANLSWESRRALNAALPSDFPQLQSTLKIEAGGQTKVDITAEVSDALLEKIVNLGGTILSSVPQFDAVCALVPLTQLETLAEDEAVRSIMPSWGYMLNKTNTSEGDVAHAADTARTTFTVDGTGVAVGVLSDSAGAVNLANLQASGDLPATVNILAGQQGSGTDEGLAMLEIVFDLAPGADLHFATANPSQAQFAANILGLQAAGCDVIVDDVFYFAEPVYQDGIIAQAVDTVTAAGASYFSSAGNSGNLNDGQSGVWEGDYSGIALPAALVGFGYTTAHDFGGGTNSIAISTGSSSFYVLNWSDEMASSSNDYDLVLMDATLTTVLGQSTGTQDGNDQPIEGFSGSGAADVGRRLVVIEFGAAADRMIHLTTNRGRLTGGTAGQTCGHSCARGAMGVAASDATLADGAGGVFAASDVVESFSSDGPRRVHYEGNGTAITPGNFSSTGGELRQKPEITAADGVATATPGFGDFHGTSAAAPHAAAIAALLIDQGTATTPAQIRSTFENTATDIEGAGVDRDSGVGIVMADDALAAPVPVEVSEFGVE